MISKTAFLNCIRQDVFPKLAKDEEKRKRTLAYMGCVVVAGLVLSGIAAHSLGITLTEAINKTLAAIFNDRADSGTGVLFPAIAGFVIAFILYHNFLRKQKKKYLPLFIKCLGKMEAGQQVINGDLIRKTQLFPSFDKIDKDDSFSGTLSDTFFSVQELELKQERYSSKRERSEVTVFQGVLIDIPLKKTLKNQTLLVSRLFSGSKINKLNRVKLESIEFERRYQAYSNDQIESRALLTPLFMERLTHLKNYFNADKIEASFFKDHAFFALHTKNNVFESYSLWRSGLDLETYRQFYDEVKAIEDMIKALHLQNKDLDSEVLEKYKAESAPNPDDDE